MITGLYAGLLSLLYLKMTFGIIAFRRSQQISLGAEGNKSLELLIATHRNFIEYIPLALILLYFAEHSDFFPYFLVHLFGASLLIGRVLHYLGFKEKMNFKFRVCGMILTLVPLVLLAIGNILNFIKLMNK